MTPAPLIRAERPDDAPLIAAAIRRAYADVPHSDHREQLMVERLGGTTAFVPALSLVATVTGEVAGHILLTRAHIRRSETLVETLALAPLSVVAEHRQRGVAGALVTAAHRCAAELGFGSVMLVGIPGFYERFGYRPMAAFAIRPPFAAPPPQCLVCELTPGALSGVSGVIDYAPGWLGGEASVPAS